MKKGFRIAGILWALVGLALSAWSLWGLVVQPHTKSVVASWCIALAYGVLCLGGGLLAAIGHTHGRYLLVVSSAIALLYVLVHFFFGGLADAFAYLPGVLALLVLSTYSISSFQSWAHKQPN